jgi:hypothetical protein
MHTSQNILSLGILINNARGIKRESNQGIPSDPPEIIIIIYMQSKTNIVGAGGVSWASWLDI